MKGAIAVQALLALTGLAAGSPGGGTDFGGQASDGSMTVHGSQSSSPGTKTPGQPSYEYKRMWWSQCMGTGLQRWCTDDAIATRVCADGTPALAPLFRHEVDATGHEVAPWDLVDPGGCPEDAATPVLTAEEFARLPLTPSSVRLQPADGRALVHYGVITTTDPAPQTLTTTILGTPITVTATPTSWTWDYGDGTPPRTTSDPGAPYPDTSGAHPYDTPGTYRLTLTTTWSGTYQVGGTGPQQPVTGTATTTSAPVTITVETAHPHLVTGP